MRWTRSTSRGRASATAALNRLTACEPPKTSRTRPPGGMPSPSRAASRSTPRVSRMGVPVSRHGRRVAERRAGRPVRDGDRRGEPGRRADAPSGDDVALPEQDGDPEDRGREEDRDRDVPAGREDRVRAVPGEEGQRLRDGQREADRVGDEVDVALHRSERSEDQAAQGDPGRSDDPVLEASVSPDPAEVRRVRPAAEGVRDGESRVDVAARAPARDQQAHRSPGSCAPPSPGRSTGGSRRRRS